MEELLIEMKKELGIEDTLQDSFLNRMLNSACKSIMKYKLISLLDWETKFESYKYEVLDLAIYYYQNYKKMNVKQFTASKQSVTYNVDSMSIPKFIKDKIGNPPIFSC